MVSFGARESSHPLVSVIIPTYNRAGILKKCLSAIALQHFPFGSFEIIVVDDGSSDNTEEVVRQVSSRFEIRYFHQNNSGPAAARNRGVQHARSELILIMNDDAIAADNLVAGHYYMHRKMKSKRLAVLGTREFRNEDKVRTLNFLYDQVPLGLRVNSQMQGFYSADYFVTFNISMGKRDFEETGGFDEDFTTALGEDTEFGVRWAKSDGELFFFPQLKAYHDHDMTADGLKSQTIRYHYNRLIVLFKQRPYCPPLECFRQTESEMQAYVERFGPACQRIEADLRECERLSIWEVEGRKLFGKWIGSIIDFVLLVRELFQPYSSYVTLHRYLTDPEARAFVQKWGGPNNTD